VGSGFEVMRVSIAERVGWVAVALFAVLAMGLSNYQLFGLVSVAALTIGAILIVNAFSLGNEWSGGGGWIVDAEPFSLSEGVLGAKWTWVRLAHAFDVVSAGLLIWLAMALAVDTAANAILGSRLSPVVRVSLAALTLPIAVLWPAARWPPPVAAGQRLVPALVKRSIILGVVLTPYVAAAAFPIDILVSQISTLSLSRVLVAFGVIAVMIALAFWLGYRLSPAAFTQRRNAELAFGLGTSPTHPLVEPVSFEASSGRFALAGSIFETMCGAAVIGAAAAAVAVFSVAPEDPMVVRDTELMVPVVGAGLIAVAGWIAFRRPGEARVSGPSSKLVSRHRGE